MGKKNEELRCVVCGGHSSAIPRFFYDLDSMEKHYVCYWKCAKIWASQHPRHIFSDQIDLFLACPEKVLRWTGLWDKLKQIIAGGLTDKEFKIMRECAGAKI